MGTQSRNPPLRSNTPRSLDLKRWTNDIDPATIPDAVLKTERARRNALKRESYSGGMYWKQHNPDTPRCRCLKCMELRGKRITR